MSMSMIQFISKPKIKLHGDEVTNFYDEKIPKLDSNNA